MQMSRVSHQAVKPLRSLTVVPRPVGPVRVAMPVTGLPTVESFLAQPSSPPPPPSSPAPAAPPATLPPASVYKAMAAAGGIKGKLPSWKTLLLGIAAGCYVSFGGFMAVTAATMASGVGVTNPILTRLIMGIAFPFGLLMVLVCGAELYTGNTAAMTAAVYEGDASVGDLARNWVLSYAGNLLGSAFMVGMVAATGLLASSAVPVNMAVAKTSIPLTQLFARSMLCNWLVCVAVWMATASSSLPGKFVAAFLPVCAFVTMGLEHSVANMFFILLGIAQGAPVSLATFLTHNLLPVTLGNTLAGVLFMGTTYGLAYGALGLKKQQ